MKTNKEENRGVKKGTVRGEYNKNKKKTITFLGNRYSEEEVLEMNSIIEEYRKKYPKKRDAILEIFRKAKIE